MPKTKVKVKNLKPNVAKAKRELAKLIFDNKLYTDSHQFLVDDIRKKALNPQTGKKYKALKSTQHRKYIASTGTNVLHKEYKESKPNLTITGSLLEGLFTKFQKTKRLLIIAIKGRHDGYKNRKGKTIKGSKAKRSDIVEGQAAIGRPIMVASRSLRVRILKRIEKRLKALKVKIKI